MFSSRHKIVAPKIVNQTSSAWKWWLAVFIIFSLVWSWLVFDYARKTSIDGVQNYEDRISEQRKKINRLNKQLDQVRLEAATHKRSAQIDRSAAELAREDMKRIQQETAELKQEVEFLTSLLSDKVNKGLIRVKGVDLIKLSGSDRYKLSFTLVHLSKVGGKVSGQASISVSGTQGEESVTLTMKEVSIDGKASRKMGFKNYQSFEVTMQLPKDFIAEKFTIIATPEGDDIEEIEQTQPWAVIES
jgi:PBP1b-binding outer membrane lipoprotein LpoB